jgi:predicted transcriptional regulator
MVSRRSLISRSDQHTITFNPDKQGLRKVFGDLEADIMEIIWSLGSASVRDVCRRINLDRPLAYTTIMTVMSRLAKKGVLLKEKVGPAYVYVPVDSKESFTRSAASRILQSLFRDFTLDTMAQLVESVETVQPDAIRELEKVIDQKRRYRRSLATR